MEDLRFVGRILLIAGALIAAVGGLFLIGGRMPWLGHLPGDISIQRRGFRFYFPLATCLLLSALLSLVIWLVRRILR